MANPQLGALADPFTAATLNTAVWNATSAGVSIVAPGRVGVPVTAAFPGLGAGTYDATGQAVYGRVTPATAGTGGKLVTTLFRVALDASNLAQLSVTPGTSFQAQVITAGVTSTTALPAYDPAGHAWWRLRETGTGSFEFATSADGFAWSVLATMAHSWSAAAVSFFFQAGTTDGTTGNSAYLEHLNTMAGASGDIPSSPTVRFQVAFNQGANTSGQPAFVDLSHRLRQSWSADLAGRQYEMDQVQSGQLTATLANTDGALDPLNTASPYSPNVLPMRRCRMQMVWPRSRNLIPQDYAAGTAPGNQWSPFIGTVDPVTGLAPAPTGHTTATAWTFPITASSANGYPLLTGITAGGADETAFPVVGGASYSITSWVSRSAGGDASLGLLQRVIWYDATGADISGTNGTASVSVLGTWSSISTTGTAPANAVSARVTYWLTNTATTAVNTVYITALQMERAATATPWTSGGVVYPTWSGFVERWPQQWNKSGTYGLVDLTCVDALAALSSFTLEPNFAASLLALSPLSMYPFTEPAGSTQFADATGHRPVRRVSSSALGSGSATITAGTSVQGAGSVGSAGPVVTLTNPNFGHSTPAQGRFIDGVSNESPPTSGGWTRVVCFRTTSVPTAGNAMCLWAATGPGAFSGGTGSQAIAGIYIDSSQHVYGSISNASGSASGSCPVADIASCDGNWHIAVVQLSSDGKTFTVANDNHGYQITTLGDFHPTGCTADTIGAVANSSAGACNLLYSGDIAYATTFPTAIGNGAAFDLGNGFATGWSNETSAARAQRILTMAGYQGKLATLDATTPMGGANLAGVDAMSALQLVGDTEAGQVYTDGAGVLWLASRTWRYLQNSPVITFGEHQYAGEVPYLGDVEIELDDTHIFNDVTVINQPLPGAAEQPGAHYSDATSQAQYLPKSLQRTINVQDTSAPQAAAQYLIGQYAQPLARVGQLTVDGAANPALWTTILPLTFGTRAQVARRPPAPAPSLLVQQFIEALTWQGDDAGNLKLLMEMSPAQPYLGWWVVSSLHTTVRTASTAGTATVTLNPLTGAASNPARAVLSPGTVLTLGYGTANSENLTVLTVSATTAGYASVAVTFTTNTTHNHAVNEVVCQPLPAGVTLPPAVLAGYPASLDAAATLSATTPRVAY